jgi:hypothetical protein
MAPAPPSTPPQPSPATTRSGRHIHFSARSNIYATISAGGDVGTYRSEKQTTPTVWQKAGDIYTLQIAVGCGTPTQALIAETRVIIG